MTTIVELTTWDAVDGFHPSLFYKNSGGDPELYLQDSYLDAAYLEVQKGIQLATGLEVNIRYPHQKFKRNLDDLCKLYYDPMPIKDALHSNNSLLRSKQHDEFSRLYDVTKVAICRDNDAYSASLTSGMGSESKEVTKLEKRVAAFPATRSATAAAVASSWTTPIVMSGFSVTVATFAAIASVLYTSIFFYCDNAKKSVAKKQAAKQKIVSDSWVPLNMVNMAKLKLLKSVVKSIKESASNTPDELNIIDDALIHQTQMAGEALLARRQRLVEAAALLGASISDANDMDLIMAKKAVVNIENEWDVLYSRLTSLSKAMAILADQTHVTILRRNLRSEIDQATSNLVDSSIVSQMVGQAEVAQTALVKAIQNLESAGLWSLN